MDKNKIAVEVFNKMAQSYQDKFMDVSLYGYTLDFLCEQIEKQNAIVLELACGPGNITKYLLNKRPDLKITGTDLAPNMVALAKTNNPCANFEILDCRNINQLPKNYDAIVCGFCLPYLSKEEAIQLIKNASAILRENGVLYLSTMEDDYSKSAFKKGSGGDEIFMHYHQADYLTETLTQSGFTILKLQRQDYPNQDNTKTTDLIIIAKK